MATTTFVSIAEYLSTSYRPDREYIDGAVVERNVGEQDHSSVQTDLSTYLNVRRNEWGIRVYVEQRVQVKPTRFRVPDICVVLGGRPAEQIFTKPPFMCIEIVSPEDRWTSTRERVNDYLEFGVPYVWILDPRARTAWRCTPGGTQDVSELRTENPEIVVPLSEIWG